ncbi:expressed unknown protein [Seminavis robusta]|uniref:Uncharacterized protein n=1 Tax=Seminavis robusta TaxID=568900 RepID=A0A9N8H8U3_9STRA|nr:expressed unknown protein [Seminavis robusta]|eukprot:Sro231_g093530.1 n/a (970) ;mRNA; f:15948-19040
MPFWDTGQQEEKGKASDAMASNGERLSTSGLTLESALDWTSLLLSTKLDNEQDMEPEEIKAAVKVYKELHRILKLSTRTEDTFGQPLSPNASNIAPTSFHEQFIDLQDEIKEPRPLTKANLAELNDFLILDNSLRETTVGSARGHTLEEKHQIVDAIADTGLEEIILGAFGSKISVDSQIAGRWKALGKSFDNAWGFSEAFDLEGFDEEPLWQSTSNFINAKRDGTKLPDYWVPTQAVKTTYSKDDLALFKRAYSYFPQGNVFSGRKPKDILKESESPKGRIPMGLLMMAGYGICNAIIEVDTAVETFDYETYNLVERCQYLMQWCKDNFPQRQNVKPGEDDSARIFINCRDFVNYQRSDSGLEMCLYMVDQLCRLPPNQRPFGFLMEDPTGWLWPDEVGRLTRLIKATMNQAGHPDGKFLVHLHMYFAMAEACVLSSMCNGADGVWAALCKTGAQVGHACSTITAVNLYRAGVENVANKYNLSKMCEGARLITKITTKEECPEYEEVYGEHAFDTAFFMYNVPSCRYAIAELMIELGIDARYIRLNEISLVSAIDRAMEYHFGKSEEAGWDPKHCPQMWNAIANHLVTGISRDYNSPLGLGTLYALVSGENLPRSMIHSMLKTTKVLDTHPTVIEFVHRWNRLCAKHLGKDFTSPICETKCIMLPCINLESQPRLASLPFKVIQDDYDLNPAIQVVPQWARNKLKNREFKVMQDIQKTQDPLMTFEERLLSLKLFIEEAESLQVLPIVDDFACRLRFNLFFGEGDSWLKEVRMDRPSKANKRIVRAAAAIMQRDGNHALHRMVMSLVRRVQHNVGLQPDLLPLREDVGMESLIKAFERVDGDKAQHDALDKWIQEFETNDSAAFGNAIFEVDVDDALEAVDRNELLFGTEGEVYMRQEETGCKKKGQGSWTKKVKRMLSKEMGKFSPNTTPKSSPKQSPKPVRKTLGTSSGTAPKGLKLADAVNEVEC